MAIRLGEHVQAGTIDNSKKGRVRGSLRLLGREKPIRLDLQGNAHLDLAGRILEFRNPAAVPLDPDIADYLEDTQTGFVGDMTSLKRSLVMETHGRVEGEEADDRGVGEEKTVLHIEWFGHRNGRIVIEGLDHEWSTDEARWELNDEEIGQQVDQARAAKELHLNFALELFQETNEEIRAAEREIDPNASDEFSWEKRLQESDRRAEAFHALLEEASSPEEMERLADLAFSEEIPGADGEEDAGVFEEDDEADWSPESRDLYQPGDAAVMLCREIRALSKSLISDYHDELLTTVGHGDFLALVVKAQTASDLVERGEGSFERGFLIAHVKREIARSQHLISQLQNEPTEVRKEVVEEIWNLREQLVDLAGQLRADEDTPF